jgi:hypothetical protein
MGKLFTGLIAVIFMAGGLTALNVSAAQAACPYTGCIDTTCHADNINNPRVGNPAKVKFRVGTAGNGAARGPVSFVYKRVSNGNTVGSYTRSYTGPGWERYAFGSLPRGKYVVRVHFNSSRNSSYENCRDSFRQTVRPRR